VHPEGEEGEEELGEADPDGEDGTDEYTRWSSAHEYIDGR